MQHEKQLTQKQRRGSSDGDLSTARMGAAGAGAREERVQVLAAVVLQQARRPVRAWWPSSAASVLHAATDHLRQQRAVVSGSAVVFWRERLGLKAQLRRRALRVRAARAGFSGFEPPLHTFSNREWPRSHMLVRAVTRASFRS